MKPGTNSFIWIPPVIVIREYFFYWMLTTVIDARWVSGDVAPSENAPPQLPLRHWTNVSMLQSVNWSGTPQVCVSDSGNLWTVITIDSVWSSRLAQWDAIASSYLTRHRSNRLCVRCSWYCQTGLALHHVYLYNVCRDLRSTGLKFPCLKIALKSLLSTDRVTGVRPINSRILHSCFLLCEVTQDALTHVSR